jgi:septal ring factor EnvC (AmiA/AmiB activator)
MTLNQKIFDLYIEGYSIKRIAFILTELQIPTPTVYKQRLGYTYKNPNTKSASFRLGVWGTTTVSNILTNNTYIGILTQGKEKKLSYKSKKVVKASESEWVVKENNHEAIIDKSMFYQVQTMLKSKRTVSGDVGNGNKKHKAHSLAGKVKCPECGSSLIKTGGSSNQESRYLRCQLANKTRNKMCTPHAVRLNELKATIASEIHKLIDSVLNGDNEKYLSDSLKDMSDIENKIEIKTKELNSINRVIQEKEDIFVELYMDKVKKIITEEEYISLKNKINNEIDEQQAKHTTLKNEIERLKTTNVEKSDVITLAKKYASFDELTTEIVAYFIDYVTVSEKDMYGDQGIHIYWNI